MLQNTPTFYLSIYKSLWLYFILITHVLISACSSSSSSTPDTAVETCYDVRVSYAAFSQTNNLCTTKENGGFNGLGVFRFLSFSLLAPSTVTIQVTRTSGLLRSDPDLILFKNGVVIESAESSFINSETLTKSLGAGDYVVELSEFKYVIAATKYNTTTNSLTETVQLENLPSAVDVISSPPCNTGNDNTVSGNVTFERVPHNGIRLDYDNTITQPVQQAVVSLMCNNQEYSSTVTDANGFYSLKFPAGQDSFVRVRSQMKQAGTPAWDVSVVDNTVPGQPTYVMDSLSYTEAIDLTLNLAADSGWTGVDYTLDRVAAPFAILDSVRKAMNKVLTESPDANFPQLNINWSVLNTTSRGDIGLGQIETSFFDGEQIYLLGAKDNDTDEYDEHVIIHEWGHYFERNFSRSDSIGGPHTDGDILDIRVAFGEGFGNAFSAMVTDDPVYIDVAGPHQIGGFVINIESNNCFNPGWYSECSVQSILYDLYDSSNEFGDALSLGFSPIYNVLITEQKNTPALTSVFSFIKPLKDLSDAAAIDVLVGAQSIDPVIGIYGESQLNNNPGETDQLPIFQAY